MKAHGRQAAQTTAQDGEQQKSLTFGRGKTKEKEVEPFSDGGRVGLCGRRQEFSFQKALLSQYSWKMMKGHRVSGIQVAHGDGTKLAEDLAASGELSGPSQQYHHLDMAGLQLDDWNMGDGGQQCRRSRLRSVESFDLQCSRNSL